MEKKDSKSDASQRMIYLATIAQSCSVGEHGYHGCCAEDSKIIGIYETLEEAEKGILKLPKSTLQRGYDEKYTEMTYSGNITIQKIPFNTTNFAFLKNCSAVQTLQKQ